MKKFNKERLFKVKEPLIKAEKALDKWLEDEQLFLSARKKQKVTALVAYYFETNPEASSAQIRNFLGNLAGGADVDFEDPDSVEIEIQRILGHTEPLTQQTYRPLLKAGIALLVLNILLIAFNMYLLIMGNQSSQPMANMAPITTIQVAEIQDLLEAVAIEETNIRQVPYSADEIWDIIRDTDRVGSLPGMTQTQFVQVRNHLMKWLELSNKTKDKKAQQNAF